MQFINSFFNIAFLTSIFGSSVQTELVQRKDFFRDIIGIDESTYRNVTDHQKAALISSQGEGDSKTYFLHNNNKTQTFQMGAFKTYSLGELRTLTSTSNKGGGTLHLIHGNTMSDKRYVDSGSVQAMPENRDAVFQVASNFNGLETVSQHQNIDEQFLGDYVGDKTQGPFASISAFPGLMLRHYYMFYDQNQERGSDFWCQRADGQNQINLLENLRELLPMSQAGYVQLNHVVKQRIMPQEEDLLNAKIGYHRDVQVVFGQLHGSYAQGYPQHVRIHDPLQIINQVFTAATDFGFTNVAYRNNYYAQQWGKMIIRAAYEGTIRLAAAMEKKRVILTLVGGGVFNNPHSWIADAIYDMKDFIKRSGLQVFVCVYGGGQDPRILNEFAIRDTFEQFIIHWKSDTENPYNFQA